MKQKYIEYNKDNKENVILEALSDMGKEGIRLTLTKRGASIYEKKGVRSASINEFIIGRDNAKLTNVEDVIIVEDASMLPNPIIALLFHSLDESSKVLFIRDSKMITMNENNLSNYLAEMKF